MNEAIQQLQAIEQNMQSYGLQKQTIQTQLLETESALQEISKNNEAFRIVGNIMVKADIADLKKELEEKAATLKTRLSTVEKQEERLRTEAEALQKQIMTEMGEKK